MTTNLRRLASILAIATVLAFGGVAAQPHHAAASGCCMQIYVYFDGGPDGGNASPQSLCLWGYNQNWQLVYDCQQYVYPVYGHTYYFPNYWYQSGCCQAGTGWGYMNVQTYYTDGTYTWVNEIIPYQSNCYGSYWALVFSNETISSC